MAYSHSEAEIFKSQGICGDCGGSGCNECEGTGSTENFDDEDE